MAIGLLLLPVVAYFSLEGNTSVWDGLYAIDPALLDIWGPGGLTLMNFVAVLGLLSIGIGFMGSPQVYVRFISIKSADEVHIHKSGDDGEEVDISSGNEKVAFGLSQGSRLSMHRC